MKKIFCITLIALTSLASFAADDSPDVKTLQGSWVPAKAELGGQPLPADVLNKITLTLTNHDYVVTITGEQSDYGTWSLDTAAKPKGMTIVGTKGPNTGKTFPCIYEIKADTLRICYDLSGASRPTDFKSTFGTKLYIVTYNRKK
jgi:uncharacterized protein (TIGR03067 family)